MKLNMDMEVINMASPTCMVKDNMDSHKCMDNNSHRCMGSHRGSLVVAISPTHRCSNQWTANKLRTSRWARRFSSNNNSLRLQPSTNQTYNLRLKTRSLARKAICPMRHLLLAQSTLKSFNNISLNSSLVLLQLCLCQTKWNNSWWGNCKWMDRLVPLCCWIQTILIVLTTKTQSKHKVAA